MNNVKKSFVLELKAAKMIPVLPSVQADLLLHDLVINDRVNEFSVRQFRTFT